MNPTHSVLRSIFSEAVEIADPAERAAFLDSACKGDAGLRARVEQLLAAESRAGGFLRDRPGPGPLDPFPEAMGNRIGRYRLIERIGQGGYGVVYLAEQEEPVRRQVALKIIKLGMDTGAVVMRFEAERQALAVMDHPNIARVFDAGATESGRPFFVMELVRGEPITDYCRRNSLTLRQRLELFVQVANGVQHAHQKGIIHRDLKPSNILVTEHDGRPVPKVIDFGIAKATSQTPSSDAAVTSGHEFVGTPAYMSPEQVQFGTRDLDTRSDIYSLGVILYELMTGQPPFDPKTLANLGLDEMRRLIQESDPPRPSTRLTKKVSPQLNPTATRAATRDQLAALRGDVDWIVMKCLEKDRSRRYETANALVMDIRRHLENKTIAARPPTAFYRTQKIFRRNRASFTAVAVVLMVLVLAVIVSGRLAVRATHAEHEQTRLRGLAETKAGESQHRLIRRYVAEGNRLMEAGLPLVALPWMVEALALEAGDPEREPDERLRIAQACVGAPELKLNLSQGKWVHCVALTADGSRLATGSEDGIVRISDVAGGGTSGTNLALPGSVRRVRFSPDGTRLVAIDGVARARVWNTATGEATTPLLQAEDFSEQSIANVANRFRPEASFSPDGKWLLLAWGSKSADLRDAANGALVRRFTHGDVVYHAAFSPNGNWVVTSSRDRTARVWEVATGKPAGAVLEHEGMVAWAQFSSDGSKLLTARERHFMQLWDWREGRRLAPEIPRRSELFHGSLSPDQTRVLTVARSGYAHLYDATSSQLINQFEHQGGLVDAAFSPNGRQVAIACHDGNVWVWAVDDSARRPMLLPEGNQIEEIAFSRNGRLLAVGTRGGHARVWELAPPERGVQRLPGKDVQWVEFDSSGARALIVSSGEKPAVSVYDAQACKLISTSALRNTMTRARFSPDGRRILAFGSGPQAVVLEAASGRELIPPVVHKRKVQEAFWSPDGQFIVSGATTGGVRMWDSRTGKIKVTFPDSTSIRTIALSTDGTRLAIGREDKTVQLWQTLSGRPEGPLLRMGEAIHELRFSPDGTRLAISTYSREGEGIVQVREMVSGKLVGQPLRHRDDVMSLEFSRDGSALATTCNDHTARIWNAATGEPLSPWLPHDFETRRASFSPDGKRLVTLARRGATRLWSARTGEAITAPIIYTRNSGDGGVSYSPDGGRLLIARGGNEAWLRELQPERASLEELKLRAQVLSCTRFDAAAGMVPLDEASLNSAWERLRALHAKR